MKILSPVVAFLLALGLVSLSQAGTLPISSADYYQSGEVSWGQKLLIEMSFDSPPSSSLGNADGFIWAPGSSSNFVVGTVSSFYIGNTLVGSSSRSGPGFGGILSFASDSALGQAGGLWKTVIVDGQLLQSFFSGTSKGILEIIPSFDRPSGHIMYGSQMPHAVTYSSPGSWEDIFPSPTLLSSKVVALDFAAVTPIPEPETFAMMIAGLGLIGVLACCRKQKLSA